MKLNMMVVMTMWLPRLVCSQAGMKAQAAPNRPPAMMASGGSRANGNVPEQQTDQTDPEAADARPAPHRRC